MSNYANTRRRRETARAGARHRALRREGARRALALPRKNWQKRIVREGAERALSRRHERGRLGGGSGP